ncbi:hypothetical protein ACVGVM_09750 [Pseudonocardia bannensis]|uniref:Uncharacterized protein n=1 Tax=Pseudonocardia bannensis TaxID=630973 RepID=A0A848DQZ1_9PSEU|nr:hypothetical protein [Pseudonocardia bannensis]NMH95270.1 hypothetical protein [Pseudonocardia bannensis]
MRLEITAGHPIYRALAASAAPEWAVVLAAHLDRWYAGWHPATIQHDALTLSAALELPFVDSVPTAVTPRRDRPDDRGHGGPG